jgi:hypothetical protein
MSCKVLNIFNTVFNRDWAMAKALGEAFLKYNLVKCYIKLAKQGLYYWKYN